jgi:UDP-N-acetyl-D-mannosaminuronic acid dehydrogenase
MPNAPETAELVKLIENAYRDVNIAFANEVANVGEAHGLNPWEAIELANRHPRVNILNPGPGVGGHCIAVDPWFLISDNGDLTGLMAQARRVNDGRPESVIAKIRETAEAAGTKKIACLGLAFKPNVDDLRESPAIDIAVGLAEQGFDICAVEPHVNALPERLWRHDNIRLAGFDEALAKSDIIVLLVGHKAFLKRKGDADGRTVIDAVGLWREPSRAA